MRAVFVAAIAGGVMSVGAAQDLPAFPEAEGFGASATGGRGGKVIWVTNLEDSGPGSLRDAVESWSTRTVLFKVSGTIPLRTPLTINYSNITIAGQSAPGEGITLAGKPLLVKASNVVIRHIRSRLGDGVPNGDDAVSIMSGSRRVILDHVSASWSQDETLSPSGDIGDITVQWSLIAESLNKSFHKKGEHGYGSLVRATGGVTLHHNLWAHHRGRSPRLGDNYGTLFAAGPVFDLRNNVIYDWGDYATGLVDGKIRVNYVNNYLRPGPSTRHRQVISLTPNADEQTRFYISGTVLEGAPGITPQTPGFMGLEGGKTGAARFSLVDAPFITPPVTTQTAETAYEAVLAGVGACAPVRDAVDLRILRQVRQGSGGLIDSQNQIGGWPALATGEAWVDSDGDGLPDAWELVHGLDPKNAKDAQTLSPSGYPWLEVWLQERATCVAWKL